LGDEKPQCFPAAGDSFDLPGPDPIFPSFWCSLFLVMFALMRVIEPCDADHTLPTQTTTMIA